MRAHLPKTLRGFAGFAVLGFAVSVLSGCSGERLDWTLSVGNERASPVVVRVVDRGRSSEWTIGARTDSLLVKLDHPLDGEVVVLNAADCTLIARAEPMPLVGDVWLWVLYVDAGQIPSEPVEVVRHDGPTRDVPNAPPDAACRPS